MARDYESVTEFLARGGQITQIDEGRTTDIDLEGLHTQKAPVETEEVCEECGEARVINRHGVCVACDAELSHVARALDREDHQDDNGVQEYT